MFLYANKSYRYTGIPVSREWNFGGRLRRFFGWNPFFFTFKTIFCTLTCVFAKIMIIFNRQHIQLRSFISRPNLCHPLPVRQVPTQRAAAIESRHGDAEQLSLLKILMETSGTTGLVEMRQSDHGNGLFTTRPVKKDEVRNSWSLVFCMH